MSIPEDPEPVMELRVGSVFGKEKILKNDHFPACQSRRVSPQIEGAPNYRLAGSLRVHGVAVPTIAGIQKVLRHLGAHKDGKQARVLWISLREEPIVYINGRPFVLRDAERPFTNLDYSGINRAEVEQMEVRLKEDILMEASRYGNMIPVTDEQPDGQMQDQWEPVSTDSLKTLLEVYKELQAEGYLVEYERVPVTDGKSPKEADFDALIRKISQADITTEVIFNCQTGRARTTTGMVIATLVYFKRTGASDQGFPRNISFGRFYKAGGSTTTSLPNSEEAIRRGEYAVVRSLIRALEGGVEGKMRVDKVIDRCASMQNLREAIATYRSSIMSQPDEKKREAALTFFVEYLERYYFLICFAVYLHSEGAFLQSGSHSHVSFADWMQARPELYSILTRLLRRDPMGALGYAAAINPSLSKIAESTDWHCHEMNVTAALRSGAVLGSQTVLKSDHSPGSQLLCLQYRVEGAPNFREVPGFAVYGVANPTVDGILSVIEKVWSLRGLRPVFWHNMREEPVVYINGKPCVLREVERPYKNTLEYTAITQDRVERMEALLKDDILKEAKKYGGAIMVIHETKDGQIFDLWERVDADSVQTPVEVYTRLEADGIPIQYARVPITDGKALKSSDFDTLTSNIASASGDTAFVFNCQMGRGRTTTGTIIACLVKLRMIYGRPVKLLFDAMTHSIVDEDSLSGGEETGSNKGEIRPLSSGRRTDCRAFGMDDIFLLQKITGLLDNGVESREALDAVIDRCSDLQNMREAVLQYREVFNQQHVEPRVRSVTLKRGTEYLERYLRLIAFAAYLGSETLDGFFLKGESRMTFKDWLRQRPEVQEMKWSIRQRPGRFFTIQEKLREQDENAVTESIVKERSCSVLEKGSTLQTYLCPCQKTSSRLQISEEGGDSTERIREVGEKIDRLSCLPGDVILMIVRFLSAKEAACVLVLSKTFQKLFTVVSDLSFDDNQEKLKAFSDKILSLPELTTRVRNFSLICQHVGSANQSYIDACLRRVLKLGVMDVELSIFSEDDGYSPPLEVFSCKTVVKLKLGHGFSIDMHPKDVLLPAVESLELGSVQFFSLGDCAFQGLLLASPVLRELIINGISWEDWEWAGIIRSQSLERLSIRRVFCEDLDVSSGQTITFDTPSLGYLDYADFVPEEYPYVNFDSLEEAKLDLHLVANPQWDELFPYDGDCYSSNPRNLIRGIRNVKKLELSSSYSFQVFNFFRRSIPKFQQLYHLTITLEDVERCVGFLPFLLAKAPLLKVFVINGGLHFGEEPDFVCRCVEGYDSLLSCDVETLEVTLGTDAELEQLRHFLGKLRRLQLLKIHTTRKMSSRERLESFPKASASCKIEYD